MRFYQVLQYNLPLCYTQDKPIQFMKRFHIYSDAESSALEAKSTGNFPIRADSGALEENRIY